MKGKPAQLVAQPHGIRQQPIQSGKRPKARKDAADDEERHARGQHRQIMLLHASAYASKKKPKARRPRPLREFADH
jgi:hypothetical protein